METPKFKSQLSTPELSPQEALFASYEKEIEKITGILQELQLSKKLTIPLSVKIDDCTYTLKYPHARPGKHATVLFTTVSKPGIEPFTYVVRSEPKDAEIYTENLKEKPIIDKYLPKLFAIENGWVVMEQLKGLELDALEKRLSSGEQFLQMYAKNAADALYELASIDVVLDDIGFGSGHNCIVDENDASIKIIEQRALTKMNYGYFADEIITKQLIHELQSAAITTSEKGKPIEGTDWAYDFAFQFAGHLLSKISADEFSIRPVYYKPSNPKFRFWYNLQFSFNAKDSLSDEDNKKLQEKNTAMIMSSSGYQIDPAILQAVKNYDIETFKELLRIGKFIIQIEDRESTKKIILD